MWLCTIYPSAESVNTWAIPSTHRSQHLGVRSLSPPIIQSVSKHLKCYRLDIPAWLSIPKILATLLTQFIHSWFRLQIAIILMVTEGAFFFFVHCWVTNCNHKIFVRFYFSLYIAHYLKRFFPQGLKFHLLADKKISWLFRKGFKCSIDVLHCHVQYIFSCVGQRQSEHWIGPTIDPSTCLYSSVEFL